LLIKIEPRFRKVFKIKMRKRKDYEYEDSIENLMETIKKSKLPILTLDKRWLNFFVEEKPDRIVELEKELNYILKSQGNVNSQREDLKRLKKTLMIEIVNNMDPEKDSRAEKKLIKSKELIDDINDKLILIEDRELSIPKSLNETNAILALEGLKVLEEKTRNNNNDIENLTESIEELRIELKKKILLKQKKEEENDKIFSYLNSLFGRDIVRRYQKLEKKDGAN